MTFLKQNWFKVGLGILILGTSYLVYEFDKLNWVSSDAAILMEKNSLSPSISVSTTPYLEISEDDPRFIALQKSLPQFTDYPAKTYSIPPKPLVNHQSSLYGMRYWSVTENIASRSKEYNMGGHYLMNTYLTGNPDMLIMDGLTGRVFNEPGGLFDNESRLDSYLIIFDPMVSECFTSSGDYLCEGDMKRHGHPRYVKWNGEGFITICEPDIKNWKVVSCGKIQK